MTDPMQVVAQAAAERRALARIEALILERRRPLTTLEILQEARANQRIMDAVLAICEDVSPTQHLLSRRMLAAIQRTPQANLYRNGKLWLVLGPDTEVWV